MTGFGELDSERDGEVGLPRGGGPRATTFFASATNLIAPKRAIRFRAVEQ